MVSAVLATLTVAALAVVASLAIHGGVVSAQPRLCPGAGWSKFRNRCGIEMGDLRWKQNKLTDTGENKICQCFGDPDEDTWRCFVDPECEEDIAAYNELFDGCDPIVIELDFNRKVAVHMKDVAFECAAKNSAHRARGGVDAATVGLASSAAAAVALLSALVGSP